MKQAPITKADRQMFPCSLDLEEGLIAAILIIPDALADMVSTYDLKAEHFYLKKHQIIFQAAQGIQQQGHSPDLMRVITQLDQTEALKDFGGTQQLFKYLEMPMPIQRFDSWIQKIKEDSHRREVMIAATELIETMRDPDVEPSTAAELFETKLYGLNSKPALQGGEGISQVVANMHDYLASAKAPVISTGIKDLDDATGGFVPGLWIVGGRTSMGKTHMGLHLALRAAEGNQEVLIVSAEMPANKLAIRMLANISSIPSNRLANKQIGEDEWEQIGLAERILANMPIHVLDKSNPSESDIRQMINRVLKKTGKPPKVMMIDYLQKLEWYADAPNRATELGKITTHLFNLSRDMGMTVIALAQISRATEGRSDKRPSMADLKSSGDIEQGADLIMLLYRDDYYDEDSADRGVTEILIAKARDGETGKIKVLHDLQYGHYRNMPSHK